MHREPRLLNSLRVQWLLANPCRALLSRQLRYILEMQHLKAQSPYRTRRSEPVVILRCRREPFPPSSRDRLILRSGRFCPSHSSGPRSGNSQIRR
jgi:hypothetical protein